MIISSLLDLDTMSQPGRYSTLPTALITDEGILLSDGDDQENLNGHVNVIMINPSGADPSRNLHHRGTLQGSSSEDESESERRDSRTSPTERPRRKKKRDSNSSDGSANRRTAPWTAPYMDIEDTSDLPSALIVTNVDMRVYGGDIEWKDKFEDLFRSFDDEATFLYMKSFRRARVNMSSSHAAAMARIHLHAFPFGDGAINCYFSQQNNERNETTKKSVFLKPPTPQKQFLISPPASPPEGWEPIPEDRPHIDLELIAAIANLQPGETHEIHPVSESTPGIVVHICEGGFESGGMMGGLGIIGATRMGRIQQTSRPPTNGETNGDGGGGDSDGIGLARPTVGHRPPTPRPSSPPTLPPQTKKSNSLEDEEDSCS